MLVILTPFSSFYKKSLSIFKITTNCKTKSRLKYEDWCEHLHVGSFYMNYGGRRKPNGVKGSVPCKVLPCSGSFFIKIPESIKKTDPHMKFASGYY